MVKQKDPLKKFTGLNDNSNTWRLASEALNILIVDFKLVRKPEISSQLLSEIIKNYNEVNLGVQPLFWSKAHKSKKLQKYWNSIEMVNSMILRSWNLEEVLDFLKFDVKTMKWCIERHREEEERYMRAQIGRMRKTFILSKIQRFLNQLKYQCFTAKQAVWSVNSKIESAQPSFSKSTYHKIQKVFKEDCILSWQKRWKRDLRCFTPGLEASRAVLTEFLRTLKVLNYNIFYMNKRSFITSKLPCYSWFWKRIEAK